MKERNKRVFSTALLFFLALGLPNFAFAAEGKIQSSKTLNVRLANELETLDWNKAYTDDEAQLLENLMDGLVAFDEKLNPVPSLAQSWTISPDGRTYTFKIRPGVKWTDGVALKAADFVYSWKRLLSPLTAASYAYFLFDIEGAEYFNKGALKDFSQVGVKALDDLTLQVKLVRPVAYWLQIPTFWGMYPLREDIVEKYGTVWATPGRMVTLGAYTLAAHDYDSKYTLTENPSYWGKKGNVQKVRCEIIHDNATAMNLYESGHLDFLSGISTLDLTRLTGRPDLKSFPLLRTQYLGFVTSKYPTSNVKVRRAIAMAIDKSQFEKLLPGGQTAATSWVPAGMMGYSQKLGLPYDVARAKAELRASGMQPGKPVKVDLVLKNSDSNLLVTQYIQNSLKRNLGIEVNLQSFENKGYLAQTEQKSFPTFLATWVADYPDPDNFLSVFLGGSGNNRTSWSSDKFDELVQRGRNMMDRKAREPIYLEAQRILLEEAAVIVPLYYVPYSALVRARVKEAPVNPMGHLHFRKVVLAP